jgi:hypothetical protein
MLKVAVSGREPIKTVILKSGTKISSPTHMPTLVGVAQFLGMSPAMNSKSFQVFRRQFAPAARVVWTSIGSANFECPASTLKACGYSVAHDEYLVAKQINLYLRSRLGLLDQLFTANFYLRRMRALLPLIFRFLQFFHNFS